MSGPRARREGVPVWLKTVHALSRLPGAYGLQQYLAYPTTSRFRVLLGRHVQIGSQQRVIDVACGIGTYRDVLGGEYCGVDINPAYIEAARRRHAGTFEVMDCVDLRYATEVFDHVVTIAATHHLDDRQLGAALESALRVCRAGGFVHVLDAVLPETGNRTFKRLWFRLDAGRFPRSRAALRSILASRGRIDREDLIGGPLHDCAYFRVEKPRGPRCDSP
jgi:SAM-dependent methyltransferase